MATSSPDITRIDSHQHFWLRERGDYDWLGSHLSTIYRDFLPSDLRAILGQANISQTVLIQAAETDSETDFLLTLAQETDFIAGVVGWVDMESRLTPRRLEILTKNDFFKGIRPMIQDIDDVNWMLNKKLGKVYQCLIDMGLCFDALVKPKHLKALYALLKLYPGLNVVIDHGAKPDIATNSFDDWAYDISRIAGETQAFCKLSGLITEADVNADFAQLSPYVEHLLNSFGPQRIMWGSDWPVLNLASDYIRWVEACEGYISHLNDNEKKAVWSKTAKYFYHL